MINVVAYKLERNALLAPSPDSSDPGDPAVVFTLFSLKVRELLSQLSPLPACYWCRISTQIYCESSLL